MVNSDRPSSDARRRAALTKRVFSTLDSAGASIVETHAVVFHACLESIDRMLHEAAAVGELESVQPWLEQQIEQLSFYVIAWRPGASAAEAAREALSGRRDDRTH